MTIQTAPSELRASYQTHDARVLSMLRVRELTRYQIEELLAGMRPRLNDAGVNKLLESLCQRDLIWRAGVRYALSKRGHASLVFIDQARNVRREIQDPIDPPAPQAVIPWELLRLMKRSPVRGCASAADLRPAAPRTGSLQFLQAPSRYGDHLHYRDGRVTDMAGNPL